MCGKIIERIWSVAYCRSRNIEWIRRNTYLQEGFSEVNSLMVNKLYILVLHKFKIK